jgi:zinc/manganese transport system substrate-binding protein
VTSSLSLRSLAIAGLLAAAPHGAALAETKVKAVASFSILGDMAAKIGGDRVGVTTLVGPDGDAHVYEPTPADAKAVAGANVLIVNGLGFEGWLERLTQSSGYKGQVVVATKGIEPLEMGEAHEHKGNAKAKDHDHDRKEEAKDHGDDSEKHADDRGGRDPHAWQSLANGLVYVKNITEGLCAADPEGCDGYKRNADAYSAEIKALDETIRADIAKVAETKRKVITSHDAFGYFEKAYGVEFLAPQGVSTESEASAADVGGIIRQIRKDKVTALFLENISDPRLVEQIARETGVKPGGALYSDALSAKDGPAATYLEMFKHNAAALTKAMSASGS